MWSRAKYFTQKKAGRIALSAAQEKSESKKPHLLPASSEKTLSRRPSYNIFC
jgi:hypothetical protein